MKFPGLELDVEKPFRVLLNGPDDMPLVDMTGKRAFVDVYSLDSPQAEKIQTRLRDEWIAAAPIEAMPDEVADDLIVQTLAHLTTDWYLVRFDRQPFVDDSQQPLAFSTDVALQLFRLRHSAHWLVRQVRAGATRRANFIPATTNA